MTRRPGPIAARLRLLPFVLFVVALYLAYPFLARTAGGAMHNFTQHWPIAVAMIFGSVFAGATPVGGGSVAFPILTLLLDQPVNIGREFSWAIQSLGMTAATLFVLGMRRTVDLAFLRFACAGSLVATPIACIMLVPAAPPLIARLIFGTLWCGFGCFMLLRMWRSGPATHLERPDPARPAPAILVGALGGLVAALIGGGADMVAFCYLTVRRRADPREAIPTAMMLMAATSIIALVSTLPSRGIEAGVWPLWLAAAPIVVLGAPIGAFAVSIVPRSAVLVVVALLCIAQFVWICSTGSLSSTSIALAGAAALGIVAGLSYLSKSSPASRPPTSA